MIITDRKKSGDDNKTVEYEFAPHLRYGVAGVNMRTLDSSDAQGVNSYRPNFLFTPDFMEDLMLYFRIVSQDACTPSLRAAPDPGRPVACHTRSENG